MNLLTSDAAKIVAEAERMAGQLSEVKTHQIRNFYSGITKIRVDWRKKNLSAQELSNKIILIKPKLAYATARNKKLNGFYNSFKAIVDENVTTLKANSANVDNIKTIYTNFITLMEAIVAYHKFYEEKGAY